MVLATDNKQLRNRFQRSVRILHHYPTFHKHAVATLANVFIGMADELTVTARQLYPVSRHNDIENGQFVLWALEIGANGVY
jgi:hypothetical protein